LERVVALSSAGRSRYNRFPSRMSTTESPRLRHRNRRPVHTHRSQSRMSRALHSLSSQCPECSKFHRRRHTGCPAHRHRSHRRHRRRRCRSTLCTVRIECHSQCSPYCIGTRKRHFPAHRHRSHHHVPSLSQGQWLCRGTCQCSSLVVVVGPEVGLVGGSLEGHSRRNRFQSRSIQGHRRYRQTPIRMC